MTRRTPVFRRVLDITSIAIVLTALAIVGVQVVKRRLPPSVDTGGTPSISLPEFGELTLEGQWIGPRTAPAVVLVYFDYTCGFCGELQENLDLLRRRYPQHVAVVLKHFVSPTRLSHFKVPLAAECAADQGRFTEFHSSAFEHSDLLSYSMGWRMLADSAGVPDLEELESCVISSRHADIIRDQHEEGTRIGVSLTPTLWINGVQVVGSVPLPVLDSMVVENFRGRGYH